jgi:hypothetical protein
VLVERDCVADLVGRKMSGAMERRNAFYAGRNAQAERARTEADGCQRRLHPMDWLPRVQEQHGCERPGELSCCRCRECARA